MGFQYESFTFVSSQCSNVTYHSMLTMMCLPGSFGSLSDKLQANVFGFLDVKDVAVATRVCRRVRKQVFDNNIFWYNYLTKTYLLPRIGDSSEHIGPVTLDCFLSSGCDDLSRSDKTICTSMKQLALCTPKLLAMVLQDLDCNELYFRADRTTICQRSIDTRELAKHLKTFVRGDEGLRCFDSAIAQMFCEEDKTLTPEHWSANGLRCFHLSHYRQLERPVELIRNHIGSAMLDERPRVSYRVAGPSYRVAGSWSFDPTTDYRRELFYDLFARLRSNTWTKRDERQLRWLAERDPPVICASGVFFSPEYNAFKDEKQRRLGRFEKLPSELMKRAFCV